MSRGAAATLPGIFAAAAREFAEHVAIEIPPTSGADGGDDARVRLTYRELEMRVANLTTQLAPRVQHESVVCLFFSRRSPHLTAAQLAVMRCGAAFTCIDPAFPDAHFTSVVADSGALLVITDRDLAPRVERLAMPRVAILRADEIELARDVAASADRSRADGLAYVIYTSGTTGRPKGVMIEQRSIVNLAHSDLLTFDIHPGDRVAQGSSPAYDSAIEETWLALAAGATLVVMDDATSRLGPDLTAWLRAERITVLCPPPTLLRATGCKDPASALPDLRLLYVGGEALPPEVAARWAPGRWLENGYGPTECTVTVLRGRIEAGAPVTIGRPIRGHEAFILDANGDEAADGVEGELCIRGVGLARGYLGAPALTREKFQEHSRLGRIYRTGDRARREASGDFFCLGRVDDQVKIRGHRIELGAVEAALESIDGVRAAGCRLQREASGDLLAAHIVPAGDALDLTAVRAQLAVMVHQAMVPARMALIDALPTTAGGKLDRRALAEIPRTTRDESAPLATSASAGARAADDFERAIAAVLATATGEIDLDADFFLDQGGDSLRAAVAISEIRERGLAPQLTVRDLYETRTARGLAARARAGARERNGEAQAKPQPDAAPPLTGRARPFLVSAAQVVWLALGVFAASWCAAWLASAALPIALESLGLAMFVLIAPLLLALAPLVIAPLTVALTLVAKRLLIGRYRPLRAPLWGGFYLRNWMVTSIARFIPFGLLQDTHGVVIVLRWLGARIGREVHVHRGVDLAAGGWDLLEIGDGAVLEQEAAIGLVEIESQAMTLMPISIGARARIGVRARISGGAAIGDDGELAPLSWLPAGARIASGQRGDGIPAQAVGASAGRPLAASGNDLGRATFDALLICGRIVRAALLGLPAALAFLVLAPHFDIDEGVVAEWSRGSTAGLERGALVAGLASLVGAPIALFLMALSSRALGRIGSRRARRYSAVWLRALVKIDLLRAAGDWLSGTLFWPWWLRLAGMQVGRKCEISTIVDVIADCVEIGDECFLADGIYLPCARVTADTVEFARTTIGAATFLGNHVVLPAGTALAGNMLLGVCTVADGAAMKGGASYFGHPAFELPNREIVVVDRRLTHEPGVAQFVERVFWEGLRFVLPVIATLATWWWLAGLLRFADEPSGLMATLVTCAVALALIVLVLAAKWVLLGRVRPGQHGLWSSWCSRWDFHYVMWARLARGILSRFEGTLVLAWYLRAMGAKIGRRVHLGGGSAQIVDPDMLELGDDTTVDCLFQAHSFEDRVLKIDRVKIERGASLAAGSLALYGAHIGEQARVRPHAVVMKRERLAGHMDHTGAPCRADLG